MEYNRFLPHEINQLPQQPGIYKYFNEENVIIYIGKAKNLRKRVSNYFTKNKSNRKTFKLVSEISSIEFVIVNSEFDALLLENTLIKENQPKYNILLKDDKTFPYIIVTNDRFPLIYSTRKLEITKGKYFGPFTSVKAMNKVLDLIHKLYKVRTCNLKLSEKNINENKFKVCLEFHMGNCLGPCEGRQDEKSYNEHIEEAVMILKGSISILKRDVKKDMSVASEKLEFEKAENLKLKFQLLENFQLKSLVVNPKITDVDVITISGGTQFFVNYMKIQDGSIRVSETIEAKSKVETSQEEILEKSLIFMQTKFASINVNILSNIDFSSNEHYKISVPQKSDKRKLVELSIRNSKLFESKKTQNNRIEESSKTKNLQLVQDDLKLTELPIHIECFDNSNLQGSNPVASMVCFKWGRPSKKDYRHFNIKTVEGPNDFGSMTEIVHRRYSRLQKENKSFPNLVLIDGGKGQLSAAVKALKELNLYGKIPIIGIAKRLEEIYYPEDNIPLFINKKSYTLQLLQRLRDEAHRFAITFHRDKRSKQSLESSLDQITGIGPSSRKLLLSKYKSIAKIKEAEKEEIVKIIGRSKTEKLIQGLSNP